MKNQTLKLSAVEIKVLLDSLNSVGWDALPAKHPERLAANYLRWRLQSMRDAADVVAYAKGEASA